MIRMRLTDIAAATGGRLLGGDTTITGITADSRQVRPGVLFAALPGERVDGHEFVPAALAAGAAAVLVSRDTGGLAHGVCTGDVLSALGCIARTWRDRVDPLVIGITGSNGKTTTREMVGNILGLGRKVLVTRGNYNNELGVPLTLFELEEAHAAAVLEMGASRAGDIDYLAEIARPSIGLVTNVGPAHLLGFGDEEGVARAKGEMFAALPADGWAIINADEPWRKLWDAMATADHRLYFGFSEDADVRAEPHGHAHQVITPEGSFLLRLGLPGNHNVQNALAATAVALAAGEPLERIRAGLEATRPVHGRLNLLHAPGGWTVIDDTYNANPASLYAALQVLSKERGEPWLVLGDMKELGPASRKLHAEVGDAARSLGVQRVYAVGTASEATAGAFGEGALHFQDLESLVAKLLADLRPEVVCLVKGSRSMGMERVVPCCRPGSAW
jgi:UDP-N-acetylmuramoyl-tripeptide--D-alanyl-D-alanine ligase